MEKVVVRFAPSPTGYLHIGGARTAIFNWLFARKHGGKLILRIEDTDSERSTADAIEGIVEGLKWLGLEWDAGPYFQSRFVEAHQQAAAKLLAAGKAYKCFCSKDDLESKREQAHQNKITYQYDGICRQLSAQQVAEKEARNLPFTIRFKVPRQPGAVVFEDAVYGRIEKQFQDIEDFILVRGNGQPLYVLSNAVDDIRDGITHVIRGQDGLANTPKQILIYQGLGQAPPQFAHMSLTLDPQKAKISKRKHGEQVAVHYYREKGFLPWAMVNFLVLLGWATSDSKEYFSPEDLVATFSFKGINRTNSVFNIGSGGDKFFTDPKLLKMNAHYVRTMEIDHLLPFVKEQLQGTGIWDPVFEGEKADWMRHTVELIRGRYQTVTDFTTYGRAFFNDTYPMDEAAFDKHLGQDSNVSQWLPELIRTLEDLEEFDATALEDILKKFLVAHQLKPGHLINAVRTAITGQAVGPEFLQVLICLGKERVVARLKAVLV